MENQSLNNLTPIRSNLKTFLRMLTGTSIKSNIIINKNSNKRMLTSGQLSDLFRRLDRDGNGELDLDEFTQIISKLKINATEEFITRFKFYYFLSSYFSVFYYFLSLFLFSSLFFFSYFLFLSFFLFLLFILTQFSLFSFFTHFL